MHTPLGLLAYTVRGAGYPVVLLHGFCQDQTIWDDFAAGLAEHFCVYTLDFLGFGESRHSIAQSVEEYAQGVRDILHHHQERECVVIGHSMGGYVALAFAEAYRDYVKGLGLFHSHPFADTPEKKVNRQRVAKFAREYGAAAFVKEMIPPLFAPAFAQKHPEVVAKLIHKASNYPPESIAAASTAMMKRPDRSHILRQADFPVMAIVGKQDAAISWEQSMAQTELAPQTVLHVLTDVGHMGMLEAPDRTLDMVIDFVAYCIRQKQ